MEDIDQILHKGKAYKLPFFLIYERPIGELKSKIIASNFEEAGETINSGMNRLEHYLKIILDIRPNGSVYVWLKKEPSMKSEGVYSCFLHTINDVNIQIILDDINGKKDTPFNDKIEHCKQKIKEFEDFSKMSDKRHENIQLAYLRNLQGNLPPVGSIQFEETNRVDRALEILKADNPYFLEQIELMAKIKQTAADEFTGGWEVLKAMYVEDNISTTLDDRKPTTLDDRNINLNQEGKQK